MINMLFLKIVEMSLTAGIVILVVMLVRLLIRRLPKSFAYALWIVVAFRLAVPVAADSDISVFHMFTAGRISSEMSGSTKDKAAGAERADIVDGNVSYNIEGQIMQWNAQNDITFFEGNTRNFQNVVSEDSNTVALQAFNFIEKLALVWAAGILTLVSYTAIAHIRIRRKIRYSVRLYNNVYECDNIRSPFVTGMFSPKIYLPFRLSEIEQQCILAHERYHIRRKDYLVKSFAYLLLIVYWFHPLVWAAYRLMCIDMEMSCDEKVVAEFTVDLRKEYSRLLLAFAANKRQLSA
ncbi:MAG: M56 family metallopeptidase, partial [Lachnospiraceae bacterium]|nr:M56 family metallopeptidase [Lachnospiraceae bacterium]